MMAAFGRPTPFSAAAIAATLAASLSLAHAGPCMKQIGLMQARIDARLEAQATSGATARESVDAKMRRQPTPRSIAAAEEKLGELPAEAVASVRQAMERARAADGAGDAPGCEQALADVERALAAQPAPR